MSLTFKLLLVIALALGLLIAIYFVSLRRAFENPFGPSAEPGSTEGGIDCVYSLEEKMRSTRHNLYAFVWKASCEEKASESPFVSESTYIYVSPYDTIETERDLRPQGQLIAVVEAPASLSWNSEGLHVQAKSIYEKTNRIGNVRIGFN